MAGKPNQRASAPPKPSSLRAEARRLGMSRKRLLRLIAAGLPCERIGEGFAPFDPAEVASWIEAFDKRPSGPRLAPVLNRADPRYSDRLAAAHFAKLESAIARGEWINIPAAAERIDSELGLLRSGMLNLSRLAVELACKDIEAGLGTAIETFLAELTVDDPETWPKPQPAPPPDATWLAEPEDDDRDVLPVLAAGDPRFEWAVASTERRRRKLAELAAEHTPLGEWLEVCRCQCDIVRRRIRDIPANVFWSISEDIITDDLKLAIEKEVDAALGELSGDTGHASS